MQNPARVSPTSSSPWIFTAGLSFLAILLSTSLMLRFSDFNRSTGARNLEATYHVLLTAAVLSKDAISEHFFLPAVSFNGALDRNISWGATIPTRAGINVYTSFTPPGFIIPYIFFRVSQLPINVENLAYLNAAIGAIFAIAMYWLIWRLVAQDSGPYRAAGAAITGTAVAIFSREALTSTGLVYWSQSLFQLVFIALLICVHALFFESHSALRKNYLRWSIAGLAFLAAYTEWTGYIFNIGLVLVLLTLLKDQPNAKQLASKAIAATVAAGVITIAHYALACGVYPVMRTMFFRFGSRSAAKASIQDFVSGYQLSYSSFLWLVLALVTFALAKTLFAPAMGAKRGFAAPGSNRPWMVIIFLASFPLLENFLLMQHATEFTFDRLKFVVPAGLIIAYFFSYLPVLSRFILAVLIAAACVEGLKSYRRDLELYSEWHAIDRSNASLASAVKSWQHENCSVLLSSLTIRRYPNLLFQRGIYENTPIDDGAALMKEKNACGFIYLEGKLAFQDLPKFEKAVLVTRDGRREVITPRAE